MRKLNLLEVNIHIYIIVEHLRLSFKGSNLGERRHRDCGGRVLRVGFP